MKNSHKLFAGLTAVMMLVTSVSLGACNITPNPDPNPGPDPNPPHTHTFSEDWTSDATYHWHAPTCDDTTDVKDRARHNFDGRTCTVCSYERSVADTYQMYVVGTIGSVPESQWPEWFTSGGSIAALRDACVKMELGEDNETFTAELYLRTNDRFAVYNYVARATYPAGARQSSDLNCKVEENNTYIISWKIGDATPSFKIHEHEFTEWGFNGESHWKYCAKDNTIDEDSRTAHNFVEDVCECGAVYTCEHPNGGVFNYNAENIPEPAEEGGELQKICPDCGKVIETVSYKKGFVSNNYETVNELSGEGVYFVKSNTNTLGFTVSKAGVYTLTVTNVVKADNAVGWLEYLWINTGSFDTRTGYAIVNGAKWGTTSRVKQKVAQWQSKITVDQCSFDGTHEQVASITISVEESDLVDGDLYISLNVRYGLDGTTTYPSTKTVALVELTSIIQDEASSANMVRGAYLDKKRKV